jgi:phage terminase small subunit
MGMETAAYPTRTKNRISKGNQMAGVKGRSGGARSGAGRKPNKPAFVGSMSPLEFLEGVQAGSIEASPSQIRAATALLPYKHQKLGESGKKQVAEGKARKAASKFAPTTAPKLVVNNR